jgi:uncharacterized protein
MTEPHQIPHAAPDADPPPPPPPTAPRGAADVVLFGPYGLRSGWRILLYIVLTLVMAMGLGMVWSLTGQAATLAANFAILLAASLAASWVMVAGIERRTVAALGLQLAPSAARESALGLALGAGALAAAVVLIAVAGMARWVADEGTVPDYAAVLAATLVFFAVAAAFEEVVFRGYPFQVLVQGIGVWPAVLLSSVAFALAHRGNQHVDWIALANIFLAGVMLAVAYLRTRSLWFATGIHLGWNWAMATLFDFPVSGFEWDTPLYDAAVAGPAWWTGGGFGPEGGVPATLVLLALTAWLLRTRRLSPSREVMDARPLVDERLKGGWT